MAGPKRGTAAGPSPRPESVTRRPGRRIAGRAAVGGLIGPAAFVGAWALGGALKEGYSPTNDAISRLAAIGASTRPLMTSGFVCFGIAVPAYALALRRRLRRPRGRGGPPPGLSPPARAGRHGRPGGPEEQLRPQVASMEEPHEPIVIPAGVGVGQHEALEVGLPLEP